MSTPLSQLTTMGVGGLPERLRVADTLENLVSEALEMWRETDEWLVLGGGSNLVIADEVDSLQVLKVANKGVRSDELGNGKFRLWVQAGENWDDLVAGTVAAGLAGLEALSGIPGCVGAAPIQNIGAYGAEVSSVITRVEFLDYFTGELEVIEAGDLAFGYRDSIFKNSKTGVVTMVEFVLENLGGKSKPIAFPQLATALGVNLGDQVPLAEVRDSVLKLRAAKGMVFAADDADTHGCGSFFTNPVVTERHARTLPSDAPRFEVDGTDGHMVKLSAAWLIEHAGIPKGFRLGSSHASTSTKHSLAITNRGGASAQEVLQLAEFIQIRVANQFGVNLQPEPSLIGF